MNLRKTFAKGFFWTFIETIVLKSVSIFASILMARLLGPEQIGIFGMTSVFLAIGLSLVDSGMSSSLIRTKQIDNKDYSTVFYLNVAISFLVYFIVFLCAPLIAKFFNQIILIDIIRVYSLVFIISGFSSVQLAVITKQMKFKSIMKLNIPGTLIGSIIGVILASRGIGIWSLVAMYLSIQFITTLMLWFTSSWKPQFYFSIPLAKMHFKYGYKLTLSGLLNAIFSNIYNVVIGKSFSAQSLGFFDRAKLFNDLPVQTLTSIIDRVTFPLISSIQDERTKVLNASKNILNVTFFIIAPFMLGAAALAKPIFLLVLGDKWLSAVPLFQILCLSGIFYPVHSLNINLLKVFGRTDLFFKLEVVKVFIISICVFLGLKFGIYGLLFLSVFSSYISLYVNTYYSGVFFGYSFREQVFDMFPILLISLFTSFFMYFLNQYLEYNSLLFKISTIGLIGSFIYLFIVKILHPYPLNIIVDYLRNINK